MKGGHFNVFLLCNRLCPQIFNIKLNYTFRTNKRRYLKTVRHVKAIERETAVLISAMLRDFLTSTTCFTLPGI